MRSMHRRLISVLAIAVAILGMFLSACGNSPTEPRSASPTEPRTEPAAACTAPAPLLGQFHPETPGYIVAFQDGVNAQEATQSLARKYGFTPRWIYQVTPGFAADLTGEIVAQIRCEPTVQYVEHDSPAYLF